MRLRSVGVTADGGFGECDQPPLRFSFAGGKRALGGMLRRSRHTQAGDGRQRRQTLWGWQRTAREGQAAPHPAERREHRVRRSIGFAQCFRRVNGDARGERQGELTPHPFIAAAGIGRNIGFGEDAVCSSFTAQGMQRLQRITLPHDQGAAPLAQIGIQSAQPVEQEGQPFLTSIRTKRAAWDRG